ncbi:hypothetical protein [Xanthocytophaga agilis]|uniref:Outer membrane protein beta-barrel domain-containing protein n=1 Tax=Xanthocytophaga agilis TaxID=3048010 RepID=A0AAE3UDF4_9BACT|nr:hypothetical protein [Xanthocytophaga agilis]MDJ1501778.1 hypothetical protein [Xanthocytophaga agilis]
MKYIFILLSFLAILNTSAQTSGYMGKRIAIDANFQSMAPLITDLVLEGSSTVKFRYKWNLHTEYTLNKTQTLGIDFDIVSYSKGRLVTEFNESLYDYNSGDKIQFNLQTQSLGISYRRYLKNALAPIGSYLQFHCNYLTGNIQSSYHSQEEGQTTYTVSEKNGPISGVVAGFGIGKRIIIASRFTFNFGFNLAFPYLLDNQPILDAHEEAAWDQAKQHLQKTYKWNANIGFGILL